ncbi:MAG: hypothetical protein A2007_02370 [Verrucomicrobia bacterium GWC2_42_7]|nr:MAG: hypothetical protein A2007_02370 [Verrucomicrobia bacterium GWC2_42_7]
MHQELRFPPPLLGLRPVSLAVLWKQGQTFAVEKPKDILIEEHPWYELPVLANAIRAQMEAGKKDFVNFLSKDLFSIHLLDPEVSGMAILTCNKKECDSLRNDLGSEQFLFQFTLITERTSFDESELDCDLPIAIDDKQKRIFVSHKNGKKSFTHFRRISQLPYHEVWIAETAYPRLHQIRLHAAEKGLRILGESLYTQTPLLHLSSLKKRFKNKDQEKPLIDSLALHLSSVQFPLNNETIKVTSPLPKKMSVALSYLKKVNLA